MPTILHRLLLRASLACAVLLPLAAAPAAAAPVEQEIEIPMTVKSLFGESHLKLAATEYRPEGEGPYPLVLINHGSPRSPADRIKTTGKYQAQSEAIAARGFVVINPVRRGYGKSEGSWSEDYFSCTSPAYYEAGLETAKDIEAAIDYAKGKPYIDVSRIVLVGQSAGGFGILALASKRPQGVVGVVNFAGGRGSRGPNEVCNEGRLVFAMEQYAGTTKVPMLWFYAENDHYFGPALARRMADTYQKAGVDLKFIALPPFGDDGHGFFSSKRTVGEWIGEFDAFMAKIGIMQDNRNVQGMK
jgi:dienelactone hydrolase